MPRPSPPPTPAERAVAHVAGRARGEPVDPTWPVTLHFHPDRPAAGVPLLRAMAADGRYRSQFETGTGNGGLTAHPGGDRWRWESRLFGGAYDHAPPAARPVHGSLNHGRHPVGASPRFGSAHLRLRPHVLARSTACFPDSAEDPVAVGTAERFGLVRERWAAAGVRDPLDDYVEVHVHGGVRFADDVEALVLDPCYRGTDVEADAARLGVPVEWHPGFTTTVRTLAEHPDYRGPHVVEAAARIAADGVLTPRVVGDAARAGHEDEQVLKRVWHCTARFGRPA
ncbi:DUF3626 domain-containing protein [Kineococcus radiotolerans]|uniref:DUF3626 domain-containing protein n=1 Tax=Kineococcus radiotolerans (strain ATCC BAA-149 / DSM 14245 / SRS30216) TaxID=266940 RepID=A6WG32_KINRD|nr:DUF3626 domain-containing protein [Kineococcus radiotolerans]ABS05771.1 conserved hypothetical protein [Kineococcus radiotolerans SRS30216 = ATCC BAA-149]